MTDNGTGLQTLITTLNALSDAVDRAAEAISHFPTITQTPPTYAAFTYRPAHTRRPR